MRTLAIIPVYREAGKIGGVLEKFDRQTVDEICLVVDEPSENVLEEIRRVGDESRLPIRTILNLGRKGVGHAIKQGYRYAISQEYDLIVVMAGNGKDDPREIWRLTNPIIDEGFDYVQGSRFLPGARREKTPILRRVFTRLFPVLWTLLTGVRCTEVTNGFRAYRATLLEDPRIDVWQDWLDRYELEYYLHYKVLTLGFRFAERPVSKLYTTQKKKYSHIMPLRDWWQIVGPVFLLRFGVRK